MFTRLVYQLPHLVHQPPAYAAGTPLKHWLIRGEAHQYIDYIVCFNTRTSHYLHKHTILYIFHAHRYDSNCTIKLVYYRPKDTSGINNKTVKARPW
jgi:hypothetical protein